MRERKIELEKEGMPSLSASDLVNALTEKITSKMPNSHQKNIEKAIAGEVETNTCSICFELMLPKIHSPILLFPCGHTFCKECVDHSFKTGKKTCP
jgi:Zinc finger, C3HC4 type (RING finger).